MMSVIPGTGNGINDESTIETRNSPGSPKEESTCINQPDERGANAARTLIEDEAQLFTIQPFASKGSAADIMRGKTLVPCQKSPRAVSAYKKRKPVSGRIPSSAA